jgi:hypothetical protein
MKAFILSQLQKSLEQFTAKTFRETYDAGLTDVRGPKPMNLKFFKNRVEVSYLDGLFRKSFQITGNDIVELELGTQRVNNTGDIITGAMIGNLMGGTLGAIGMAGRAAGRGHEDFLNLVIRYKGENRPLILQTSKNTQKIYGLLKELKGRN